MVGLAGQHRRPAPVRRRRVAAGPVAGGSSSTSGSRSSASRAAVRKKNRSPRNGRASRSPTRWNTAPAAAPSSSVAARRRRSVRERPSRVEGYSRLSRSKASPRKRSSGERLAAIAPRPPGWSARRPPRRRRPGRGPRRSSRGGRVEQAAELRRLQLAQPAEVGDAGVLADADQGDPVGRHPQVAEGGQDLGDLQLVVEVGLEPEQVLAGPAGRPGRGRAPRTGAAPPRRVDAVGAGEELRPDRAAARRRPVLAGTGPSCRTSAQASASVARPARRSRSTTMSPLVTCRGHGPPVAVMGERRVPMGRTRPPGTPSGERRCEARPVDARRTSCRWPAAGRPPGCCAVCSATSWWPPT